MARNKQKKSKTLTLAEMEQRLCELRPIIDAVDKKKKKYERLTMESKHLEEIQRLGKYSKKQLRKILHGVELHHKVHYDHPRAVKEYETIKKEYIAQKEAEYDSDETFDFDIEDILFKKMHDKIC